MYDADVVIIGGGIVGISIFNEISQNYENTVLLEASSFLGHGASTRNSGVIHSGIYYNKGSLKSRFCKDGNELLYKFCQDYGVPYKKTGKLIVDDNLMELEKIYRNGLDNGIKCEIIDEDRIRYLEPELKAKYAILVESTGIVDTASLINTYEKLLRDKLVLKSTKVVGSEKKQGFYRLFTNTRGSIDTRIVINSCGLYADEIAKINNSESLYKIVPVRGEYFETKKHIVKMPVYPIPDGTFLGIHLTPTTYGTMLIGPNSRHIKNKENLTNDRENKEVFLESVRRFLPSIRIEDMEESYTGIRAKLDSGNDFVIENNDGWIDLIGIDSPGLTSSLSISKYVRELIS